MRLLVALVEARSLERAAARVGLPRAELPEAIDRLRALLGEPLFACEQDHVVPTRSGLEFAAHVRPMVDTADRAVAGGSLERRGPGRPCWRPTPADPPLRLGYPAATEPLWIAETLAMARRRAPAMHVRSVAASTHDEAAALRDGRSDLLVSGERLSDDDGLDMQVLLEEPWFVVARVGHPAMGEGWDAEAWASCTHVVNRWVLDPALAGPAAGSTSAPPATRGTSDLPTWIGHLVARTSSVASVPRSIALHAVVHCRVQVAPLPFATPPRTWWLAWRREVGGSPALALAREVLVAAASAHEQRAQRAIEHFALVTQRRMRAHRRATAAAPH